MEMSYELQLKDYGDSDDRIAVSLWHISGILMNQGKHSQAVEKLVRAIEILQESETKPEILAACLNELGNAKLSLGLLNDAQSYFEKSLQLYEKVYGPDHSEIGVITKALGTITLHKKYIRKIIPKQRDTSLGH